MMEKIKLTQAVVVEGKYDKIKLSSILDACILTTEGFGLFRDREKTDLFRRLAAERGLIVATDADGAGLLIRNYFNSIIPKEQLIHIYIPEIAGKERRKVSPSKEGTLGLEGMDIALLRSLFLPFAGAAGEESVPTEEITLTDLFEDGFRGGENSEARRKALLRAASLPSNLSAKALVGAINMLGGRPYYEKVKAGL